MLSRCLACALASSILLGAPAAWADRIALLPSRGGDAAVRRALDGELASSLSALGHTLVPAQELTAAVTTHVTDGIADTQEEYRAVGSATRADWVVVASVEPAVTTERVELSACLVKIGRVESVAREVERAHEQPQVQEMLAVLARPEGIGAGALPWEKTPMTPPAAPEPPAAPPPPRVDGRARVAYPLGAGGDVWPPYSGGKRGFLGALVGFSLPAVRPALPNGVTAPRGAAFTGAVRGGVAAGDLGLEPFAELGGNLAGPRALWLAAGARWMFTPAMKRGADGVLQGAPLYLGPEITAGAFIQLGGSATAAGTSGADYSTAAAAHPVLGAALDLAFALSPSFQLEARLGDLRWVPASGGSILLAGATLGASLRF